MTEKEQGVARIRERTWVTKIDHSGETPRPVEEVFIENGELQSVTKLDPPQEPGDAPSQT